MKVRNCLSLADGTEVSGEELFQFFYQTSNIDKHKQNAMRFYWNKDEENHWLDRNATYIVEHRENFDDLKGRNRIWFRKVK